MNERIRPDYSYRLNLEDSDEPLIVNPRYDHIQQFRWLGYAILRYVSEEGIHHVHISEETGDRIAEYSGIPVAECEFMTQTDYDLYLTVTQDTLSDDWLGE